MDDQHPPPKKFRGPLNMLASSPRLRRWFIGLSVVLPLLYAASFGPACWIVGRTITGMPALRMIYRPLDGFAWCEVAWFNSRGIAKQLERYGEALLPNRIVLVAVWHKGEHCPGPDILETGGNPIDDFAAIGTVVNPPAPTPDGQSESN
jgi:hypothetical protein